MRAVKPIVPGIELTVTEFAKNQPEYQRLPAYVTSEGVAVTRWRLSLLERLRILVTGNLWLSIYGRPLRPIRLDTQAPMDLLCPLSEVLKDGA